MAVAQKTSSEQYARPKRQLRLWGAIGLSLGIMSPTLAMAGNGQGTVATVGKSVPLVFVLGAIGIALIAFGFWRLTQRYNHAGSAYALVGVTVGPRAGFFSGFAIMGAYLFFSIATVGAIGSFTNAFIATAQTNSKDPFDVPWIISGLVAIALAAFLATKDLKVITRVLLAIEGIGILGMAILAVVIFANGGADSTGIDFGTFSLEGSSFSLVAAAMVGAFLSFAGFEGCAALGEETTDPERNIPRALIGCVALTTVLFVVMMFAQTIGFGTDKEGLDAFVGSGNSLATLSDTYVGLWFSLVISFTAVISGFAALLSCSASTSRLLFAMSRDGLGPKAFGRLSQHASPVNALVAVLAVVVVVNVISYATGRPEIGTGDAALDAYFHYAVAGAMALMVAYFMVEIGAMVHIVRAHPNRMFELVLPLLGAVIIGTVFYYNVKDQTSWTASPFVAFAFVLVGLIIAVSAKGLAAKVGTALTRELGSPAGKELPVDLGPTR